MGSCDCLNVFLQWYYQYAVPRLRTLLYAGDTLALLYAPSLAEYRARLFLSDMLEPVGSDAGISESSMTGIGKHYMYRLMNISVNTCRQPAATLG